MTYYMKMTKDMKENPEKYYDLMVKASGSRASVSEFRMIVREYYMNDRYGEDTGIFIYDDEYCVCFGHYSAHRDNSNYTEVKLISTTKIGGIIL